MNRAAFTLAILAASGAALAQNVDTTRIISTGLVRPVGLTQSAADASRLYIIEKEGNIRIVKDGTLLMTPFLDIDAIVGGGNSDSSEQGLLGLALHPNYDDPDNGYFYINYTNNSGNTVIARYRRSADPDVADAASGQLLMTYTQPQSNHNGGWIGFGPDGYLYIASGDGGNFNDQGGGHTEPGGNAQDTTSNLLGKLLRIDIDGPDNIPGNTDDDGFPADANKLYVIPADNPFTDDGSDDEIWSYGLRNPWRCSFDRDTGELYIADVGQGSWEEVDVQPADSPGGENYGWRCMEGFSCTGLTGCTCNDASLTLPKHVYDHGQGCSITGGYVYRGCALPGLQGHYFFADYCTATIWSFKLVGGAVTELTNRTSDLDPDGGGVIRINNIVSFGEDSSGELYIVDQGGEIFKLVPVGGGADCNENGREDACELAVGATDCDDNGVLDECDLAAGDLTDCDADTVPDECELASGDENDCNMNGTIDGCEQDFCPADLAPPFGTLNTFDFLAFQTYFSLENPCADLAAPFGVLNVFDFLSFQNAFGNGC